MAYDDYYSSKYNDILDVFKLQIDYVEPRELIREIVNINKAWDDKEYQRIRAAEYPTVVDQLDDIYHNGIDGWKATIKTTKDKYPKG